jgi:hypothetical protein
MAQPAPPIDAAEVDRVHAQYPRTRVGSEQEYKWLIGADQFGGVQTPGLVQALELPRPAGVALDGPFSHTQSSVYLDDDWRLSAQQITAKILVNYGAYRNVAWVCAKQTVAWTEGCRDSLEISERVDTADIAAVVAQRSTIALGYIARLVPEAASLKPYATATQVRHKVPVRTSDGAALQLSLDVSTTKTLADGGSETDVWVEIETSHSDLYSRRALIEWADLLSDHLGRRPHEVAKPERAAVRAGWVGGAGSEAIQR